MGALQDFRQQHPSYEGVDDATLADALHRKYYSSIPKDEFLFKVGVGPRPAVPPAIERTPTTFGPMGGVADPGTPTRPGPPIEPLTRPVGEIASAVGTATGQAVQNVPENLKTGAEGLKLQGAELEAEVNRSDAQALGAGAAQLQAARALLQDKQAALQTAPREQRAALEADIADLRRLEGQLSLLYGDAAYIASGETRQARAADIRAREAETGIADAQASMIPVDAEPGTPEWYVSSAIASSAEMAPALLASVATRSPLPAMAFMSLYSNGRAYASGRAEGLSPGEARGYAALQAIAEGIPEGLPVAVMLKPGANVLTRIVQGAAAEAAQESLTEALQAGIDKGYIDPDMTWGEARQRIVDAGIVGSIAGPAMTGGVVATQKGLDAIGAASKPAMTEAQALAQDVLKRLGITQTQPKAKPAPAQPEAPAQDRAPQAADLLWLDEAEVEGDAIVGSPGNPPQAPLSEQQRAAFAGAGAALAGAPENWEQIKAGIFAGESGGDYDALFGYSNRGGPFGNVRITEMTVDQAIAFSDPSGEYGQWVKGQIGRVATPMGAYQIVGKTLRAAKAGLGLKGNEVMTPALQDRLGLWILQQQGTGAWEGYRGPRQPGDYGTPGEFSGSVSGVGGEQTSPQVATDVGPGTGGEGGGNGSTTTDLPATTSSLPEVQTPEITSAEAQPIEQSTRPVDGAEVETRVKPPERAAAEADPAPTEAQKDAGNYRKGHTRIAGLDITIENAKGSYRTGKDADGREWKVEMPAHYGYLKRTEGADGGQVDVYIGPDETSTSVFVVDQMDLQTGRFDELKVILGARNLKEASAIYERGFSDGRASDRMGAISKVSIDEFKDFLNVGDPTKPFARAKRVARPQRASTLQDVEQYDGSVPQRPEPALPQLRREGNQGASGPDDLQRLSRRSGRASEAEPSTRPDQERRAVRSRQPSLDDEEGAGAQSAEESPRDSVRSDENNRGVGGESQSRSVDDPLPSQQRNERRAGGDASGAAQRPSLTNKATELARKTAVGKVKEAVTEIERKRRIGDDTETVVPVMLPDGRKTVFRFPATKAGLDAAYQVVNQWKDAPAKALQENPPTALSEDLHFFTPMPNNQPMWSSLPVPAPSPQNTIDVAGESVTLPKAHKPVRRETIRLAVEKMIGARIYQGKIKGRSVAGFYRRKNGEVRLRRFDDIEVLAHELAHWLDFHSTFGGRFTRMRKKAPGKAKDQMRALSYTSDPGAVEIEGFAEYVRLWLTQYDVAKREAPDFTRIFEAELAQDKAHERAMKDLRRQMHRYFYQGPLAQFRSKVGEDETVKTATRKFIASRPHERMRQQAVDRLHGIKVAEREATGTISSAEASAYKLMQMVNGAGAVYDTVIEDGTPKLERDGSIVRRGKSLNEVFKPVYDMGAQAFDDFMLYAAGRRAQELMGQGRENLFTKSEISAALALERDGFAKVFDDFQTFNGEMLDFYVEMGLITPDQRAAFAEVNQNYVPFHRVAEVLETGKVAGSKIGKRLTGGDRNVRDLADNIVDGLMTNIRQAMIARAKRRLYASLKASDDGAAFAAKIGPDSKAVKVHLEEMASSVAEAMASMGFSVSQQGMLVAVGPRGHADIAEIQQALQANPDLLKFWQHNLPPKTKGTMVDSAIIGGEVQWFEVTDPVLIDSLMGQEMRDLGFIFQALVAVKNLRTRFITSMPPFLLKNIVRDTVSAGSLSDSGFRPGYDSLRGLVQIWNNSETYRQWKRNGGGYSSLVQATTGSKGRASLDLPGQWRRPTAILSKTLAAWDGATSYFENATRVGEFMRAMEKGESVTEAAFRSREVSTDFAKRPGNLGWAAFMQTVPFMNASLQGNDRLLQAFVGTEAGMKGVAAAFAQRLLIKSSIGFIGFTVLLWLVNQDDERYQQLTPDQKSQYWHIFFPGVAGSLKIPKAYGVGFVFSDIVENTLDYVFEVEGADVAKNLAWAAANHFWFLDYPGLFEPQVQAMKNETFTGAPVVPTYMQDLSPENQFTETTPEIYKRLGDATGLSPMRMQHYSRGYLGYLEMAIVDASELMLWDEKKYGPRPFPRGVDDYFLKGFKGAPFPYRTKYTEAYYDLRQRARTAAADLSALSKNAGRRPDRLLKFTGNRLAVTVASLNARFAEVDSTMGEIRDALDAIKYHPKLSQEAKEDQIETLYEARNKILRRVYSDIQKTVSEMEKEANP